MFQPPASSAKDGETHALRKDVGADAEGRHRPLCTLCGNICTTLKTWSDDTEPTRCDTWELRAGLELL